MAGAGDRSEVGVGGVALRVVIAIALVALAITTWRLPNVLLLVFGAILVAVTLHAAADALCRLVSMPWGLSIALSGSLILGVLGLTGMPFGQAVACIFGIVGVLPTIAARLRINGLQVKPREGVSA